MQTRDVCSSKISADRALSGFAKNLGLDTVCLGSRSFLAPAGRDESVILMGIWVSTRDFKEVGCTVRVGDPSDELIVDGGDEMSLLNVDGVVLESGSKLKTPVGNDKFGEKVAFPGESPFIVI